MAQRDSPKKAWGGASEIQWVSDGALPEEASLQFPPGPEHAAGPRDLGILPGPFVALAERLLPLPQGDSTRHCGIDRLPVHLESRVMRGLLQECEQGLAGGAVRFQAGALDLNANKVSPLTLAVVIEPVGINQAREVVVRSLNDRLDEGVVVRHGHQRFLSDLINGLTVP